MNKKKKKQEEEKILIDHLHKLFANNVKISKFTFLKKVHYDLIRSMNLGRIIK